MRGGDDTLDSKNPFIGEIGDIEAKVTGLKGGDERLLADKAAAGNVEQHRTRLHRLDCRLPDHSAGLIVERQVQRDVIAGGVDLFQAFDPADLARQMPGGVNREIGVVAENLHPQTLNRCVCHHDPDRTQADDAEGLAHQLRPDKLLLALLDQLLNPLGMLLMQAFEPAVGVDNPPSGEQQPAEHQLLDGVGVGAGGIEDGNALLGAAVYRDVVVSRARTCDRHQLGRKFCREQVGRAHKDSLVVLRVL